MKQKANAGWKPGRPPIGYMRDDTGLKGEKVTYKDPERFDLMKLAWEELLSGNYTVPQIWKRSVKRGLTQPGSRKHPEPKPLHLSTLYKAFTNVFYTGRFMWDKKEWDGLHEPIITMEQFEEAQEILGAKGKPRQRKFMNPYAGLIRCGECNGMVVVNVVEKKLKTTGKKKRYSHFRCGHNRRMVKCSQKKCIPMADLESQLTEIVKAVQIPQAFIEWALKELKRSQADRKKQNQHQLKRVQSDYKAVVRKIDNLVDLRIENPTLLPDETFDRKLKTLEEEKKKLESRVNDFAKNTDQWTEDIVNSLNFTLKLQERFASADRETRLEMLHLLGQSIQLKDGTLSFALREPFKTLAEGKVEMEAALGDASMENSLEKPLAEVDSCTLGKVADLWSG